MKKIKILLIIFMSSILTILPFNIYAYSYESEYDITDEWDTYNYFSNYYGVRILDYNFPEISGAEETGNYLLKIYIPDNSYNIQTIGGLESQLILGNDSSDIYTYDLDDLLGTTNYYGEIVISISDGVGSVFGTENDYTSLDMTSVTNFSVNMMINDTSIPSQFLDNWLVTAPVYFTVNAIKVNFYNYSNNGDGVELYLYQTQYVFDTIPTIPTDPTPPTNWLTKTFRGWIYMSPTTESYEYYDFTYPINQEYLTNTEEDTIKLIPKFLDNGEPDIDPITNPESDLPDGMSNILGIFGMNNSDGYLMLFALIHMFLIGLFLTVKRLKGKIPILISSILVTILFMTFGMIPIFVSIPMIALYIILFGFRISRGGNNEE